MNTRLARTIWNQVVSAAHITTQGRTNVRERSIAARVRCLGLALGLLAVAAGMGCGSGEMAGREGLNPVIVIFREGLVVSGAGAGFRVVAAAGAAQAPDAEKLASALAALNERVARERVLRIATVFPEGAESAGHAEHMQRIWSITLDPRTSDSAAAALASDLVANALVEQAYVQPTPEDAEPGPPSR